MSERFTEDNLKNLGYQWNGKEWVRPNKHGKDKILLPISFKSQLEIARRVVAIERPQFGEPTTSYDKQLRRLSLCLFGTPMPKQSVMQGKNKKTGATVFYQPKKKDDRKADYIQQIKKQLPQGFIPFETEVHITKFHCVYPPLKSFHKEKGKMDAIRVGEIFYKNTQPDLIDNLKKLVFDCMGKDKKTKIPLVLGNDGIIVSEDNVKKYYGTGGMILIELEGY